MTFVGFPDTLTVSSQVLLYSNLSCSHVHGNPRIHDKFSVLWSKWCWRRKTPHFRRWEELRNCFRVMTLVNWTCVRNQSSLVNVRALLKHNLCSETPARPPGWKELPFLLKRLSWSASDRTHSQWKRWLHNAGWVGGLLKLRAELLLAKMATVDLHARPLPPHPPIHCSIVHFTPLRSVHHHNLCSETTARPPGWKELPFFVKAAELKRFRSHPLAQQSPRRAGRVWSIRHRGTQELHSTLLTQIPQPICRRLPRDHRPTKFEPIRICIGPIHLHRPWPHDHNSLKIRAAPWRHLNWVSVSTVMVHGPKNHACCCTERWLPGRTAISSLKINRPDVVIPTDPMAPTKPLAVTETPAVGTKPSITNARK